MTVIELLEQKSKTLMGVESIMQRWHLGRSNDAEALESISELLKSVGLLSFFDKEGGEAQSTVNSSLLLDEDNDIDTVGKCANCGVEFHIYKRN